MKEGKWLNHKPGIKEARVENSVEQIQSMEIDWKLEDDDEIVSFDVDLERQSITYQTRKFNGKYRSGGEYYKKSWDAVHHKIMIADDYEEGGAINRFVDEYGVMAESLLGLFVQRINYQYSEDKINELIEMFSRSVDVVRGEGFLLLNMHSGGPLIINEKTRKYITPTDKKALYPPEAMSEWQKGKSVAISWGDGGVKIFDIETGKLINNPDTEHTIGLMKSENGKEAISCSSGKIKKIKFWDVDNLKLTREMNCPGDFPVEGEILEIMDGKFIVFSNGIETYVLERNTGEVINKFPGKNPKEDFRNGITVLNNGAIEFWRFEGPRGWNSEIIIRGKETLNAWERFCEFDEKNFSLKTGENMQDAFWFQASNLEAKRLEGKKQFSWGEERIYFHIKGADLLKLSGLIKHISGQSDIAVSFKYYDVAKNGQPKSGITRFVANFASVSDAKKLYEKLAENEEYKKMTVDGDADYLGYQLDEKAHYSSGYRELRENDVKNAREKAESMIKNPDGTYTVKTFEGDLRLTESEYEEIIKGTDFSAKFKKMWDEGISNNAVAKVKKISSIAGAFRF